MNKSKSLCQLVKILLKKYYYETLFIIISMFCTKRL